MCYSSAVMSNDNLSLGVKKKNEFNLLLKIKIEEDCTYPISIKY